LKWYLVPGRPCVQTVSLKVNDRNVDQTLRLLLAPVPAPAPAPAIREALELGVLVQTLVPPTLFVFRVVQPTDKVCVMVQLIGSGLSLVVILAVVARGGLLFGSLPNDTKFFVGVLDDLL
jgi:hypothetical protein